MYDLFQTILPFGLRDHHSCNFGYVCHEEVFYVYRKWKVWRSKTKEVRPLFDRPTTSTNTCSRSNSNDSLDDSMNQSRSNKAKKKASIIRYLIQVELTKTN